MPFDPKTTELFTISLILDTTYPVRNGMPDEIH